MYHDPVLLDEAVSGLNIKSNGTYVDATFGGGGHSRYLLEKLGPQGKLVAFDHDNEALANALDDPRFLLINENFRFLQQFLKFYGILKVDGVLADLGVSSHQFDHGPRGFSLRFAGDLDMRMDQRNPINAKKVVNDYSVGDLARLMGDYGELRNAMKVANTIVSARNEKPIEGTDELVRILEPLFPAKQKNRLLAQVFQAIRIEVNQEMESLKGFLTQLPNLMETSGRISIISYHSLEDRLVKRFIRAGNLSGEVEKDFYGNPKVPFKKVGGMIRPSTIEIEKNNRARSAKLRIAERV